MPTWLTGIGLKLAAFGALILGILLAILRIEKKGEAAGAAKVEAKQAQAVQRAQTTDARVDAVQKAKTDDAIVKEAEDKWTHD